LSNEPYYADPDDPWGDEDNAWRYPDSLINQTLIREVFDVCGKRKYFRSLRESKKWTRIDNKIIAGSIPIEWVNNCLTWAKGKNTHVVAIKVEALGNLILNKARMNDWKKENPDMLRKPTDYSVPDVEWE